MISIFKRADSRVYVIGVLPGVFITAYFRQKDGIHIALSLAVLSVEVGFTLSHWEIDDE